MITSAVKFGQFPYLEYKILTLTVKIKKKITYYIFTPYTPLQKCQYTYLKFKKKLV